MYKTVLFALAALAIVASPTCLSAEEGKRPDPQREPPKADRSKASDGAKARAKIARRIFDRLDKNQDGALSFDEFSDGLRRLHQAMRNRALKHRQAAQSRADKADWPHGHGYGRGGMDQRYCPCYGPWCSRAPAMHNHPYFCAHCYGPRSADADDWGAGRQGYCPRAGHHYGNWHHANRHHPARRHPAWHDGPMGMGDMEDCGMEECDVDAGRPAGRYVWPRDFDANGPKRAKIKKRSSHEPEAGSGAAGRIERLAARLAVLERRQEAMLVAIQEQQEVMMAAIQRTNELVADRLASPAARGKRMRRPAIDANVERDSGELAKRPKDRKPHKQAADR